jgi:hypothetical protein
MSQPFCRELFVGLTAKYHVVDGHNEKSRQKHGSQQKGVCQVWLSAKNYFVASLFMATAKCVCRVQLSAKTDFVVSLF